MGFSNQAFIDRKNMISNKSFNIEIRKALGYRSLFYEIVRRWNIRIRIASKQQDMIAKTAITNRIEARQKEIWRGKIKERKTGSQAYS